MKIFCATIWAAGIVLLVLDIVARIPRGYNINSDHAIALLLIAGVAQLIWGCDPQQKE